MPSHFSPPLLASEGTGKINDPSVESLMSANEILSAMRHPSDNCLDNNWQKDPGNHAGRIYSCKEKSVVEDRAQKTDVRKHRQTGKGYF